MKDRAYPSASNIPGSSPAVSSNHSRMHPKHILATRPLPNKFATSQCFQPPAAATVSPQNKYNNLLNSWVSHSHHTQRYASTSDAIASTEDDQINHNVAKARHISVFASLEHNGGMKHLQKNYMQSLKNDLDSYPSRTPNYSQKEPAASLEDVRASQARIPATSHLVSPCKVLSPPRPPFNDEPRSKQSNAGLATSCIEASRQDKAPILKGDSHPLLWKRDAITIPPVIFKNSLTDGTTSLKALILDNTKERLIRSPPGYDGEAQLDQCMIEFGISADSMSIEMFELSQATGCPYASELGRGTYGVVQRMRFKSTGKEYAVKSVYKQDVENGEMIGQLAFEIKVQQLLHHKNIVKCFTCFEDDSLVHIIMEFCANGDLFTRLRKSTHRRFNEKEAFLFFAQLVNGLYYMHSMGFMHRDLKLENLLLDEGNMLKVADFGWCANILGPKSNFSFCGTMDYLSPEMIRGEGHDWRVDIWDIGIILYEMLVGKPPFQSTAYCNLLKRILTTNIIFYELIQKDAADLIQQLLHPDVDKRISLNAIPNHAWVKRMQKSLFGGFNSSDTNLVTSLQLLPSYVAKAEALPENAKRDFISFGNEHSEKIEEFEENEWNIFMTERIKIDRMELDETGALQASDSSTVDCQEQSNISGSSSFEHIGDSDGGKSDNDESIAAGGSDADSESSGISAEVIHQTGQDTSKREGASAANDRVPKEVPMLYDTEELSRTTGNNERSSFSEEKLCEASTSRESTEFSIGSSSIPESTSQTSDPLTNTICTDTQLDLSEPTEPSHSDTKEGIIIVEVQKESNKALINSKSEEAVPRIEHQEDAAINGASKTEAYFEILEEVAASVSCNTKAKTLVDGPTEGEASSSKEVVFAEEVNAGRDPQIAVELPMEIADAKTLIGIMHTAEEARSYLDPKYEPNVLSDSATEALLVPTGVEYSSQSLRASGEDNATQRIEEQQVSYTAEPCYRQVDDWPGPILRLESQELEERIIPEEGKAGLGDSERGESQGYGPTDSDSGESSFSSRIMELSFSRDRRSPRGRFSTSSYPLDQPLLHQRYDQVKTPSQKHKHPKTKLSKRKETAAAKLPSTHKAPISSSKRTAAARSMSKGLPGLSPRLATPLLNKVYSSIALPSLEPSSVCQLGTLKARAAIEPKFSRKGIINAVSRIDTGLGRKWKSERQRMPPSKVRNSADKSGTVILGGNLSPELETSGMLMHSFPVMGSAALISKSRGLLSNSESSGDFEPKVYQFPRVLVANSSKERQVLTPSSFVRTKFSSTSPCESTSPEDGDAAVFADYLSNISEESSTGQSSCSFMRTRGATSRMNLTGTLKVKRSFADVRPRIDSGLNRSAEALYVKKNSVAPKTDVTKHITVGSKGQRNSESNLLVKVQNRGKRGTSVDVEGGPGLTRKQPNQSRGNERRCGSKEYVNKRMQSNPTPLLYPTIADGPMRMHANTTSFVDTEPLPLNTVALSNSPCDRANFYKLKDKFTESEVDQLGMTSAPISRNVRISPAQESYQISSFPSAATYKALLMKRNTGIAEKYDWMPASYSSNFPNYPPPSSRQIATKSDYVGPADAGETRQVSSGQRMPWPSYGSCRTYQKQREELSFRQGQSKSSADLMRSNPFAVVSDERHHYPAYGREWECSYGYENHFDNNGGSNSVFNRLECYSQNPSNFPTGAYGRYLIDSPKGSGAYLSHYTNNGSKFDRSIGNNAAVFPQSSNCISTYVINEPNSEVDEIRLPVVPRSGVRKWRKSDNTLDQSFSKSKEIKTKGGSREKGKHTNKHVNFEASTADFFSFT